MKSLKLLVITQIVTLIACAPGPKQPATGPYRTDFNERFERRVVSTSWSPVNVTVTCGTTACPPQVGVVIFATPQRDGRGQTTGFDLKRCTGSLIAADRVLTNAHCLTEGADAYFILPSGPSRIADVVFKTGGRDDSNGNPIAVADVALLRLDRPVQAVPPLKVATGVGPSYASLSAFVSNRNGENGFRIDRFECSFHRAPGFPFEVRENPDIMTGFDCVGQHGNSGSPLLGADGAVEAVLQSIGTNTIVAANVRCLPLTAVGPSACIQTQAMTKPRQEARSLDGWNKTAKLGDGDETRFPYRFKRQRLKMMGKPEAYEVVRIPSCLRTDVTLPNEALTEVKFPTEMITVTRDQNDNVVTNVTERRITVARVLAKQGDRYAVEADWAQPFGPLEHEEQHPRVNFGKTFSIDLPRCAR